MAYQTVFKRYEIKYLITKAQKELILKAMEPYMSIDKYGRTTIRNLYFDTDNYRLIRHSIEKPAYKEKLRVRSYNRCHDETIVFVEIKKKYDSIVYKRRVALPYRQAMNWLQGKSVSPINNQIVNEIDYLFDYYETLHPVLFLSYQREAYYSYAGDDLRITFDDHIIYRQEELSLKEDYGHSILDEDKVLMEIKTSKGIPLWMTHVLSQEKIYKTSFSKYGTVYINKILPRLKEEVLNV